MSKRHAVILNTVTNKQTVLLSRFSAIGSVEAVVSDMIIGNNSIGLVGSLIVLLLKLRETGVEEKEKKRPCTFNAGLVKYSQLVKNSQKYSAEEIQSTRDS
uniref:Uncharacterized protein n=1 Tax=Pectinophora gossypiella TaxID=13191 RepID=A0A1E1W0A1_PECGO